MRVNRTTAAPLGIRAIGATEQRDAERLTFTTASKSSTMLTWFRSLANAILAKTGKPDRPDTATRMAMKRTSRPLKLDIGKAA